MQYLFEDFELDTRVSELRRDGAVVPVEPQVFDLLVLLVGSHDRIVGRDEIFESIWGDRIVSDAALSSRIRDARRAVGDDGSAQRLIRTVHRRGLRFLGEVETRGETQAEIPGVVPAPAPLPEPRTDDEAIVLERPAIGVLPFEDRSDPPQPMLAGTLHDEIGAALSAWRYFPVISRSSVLRAASLALGARETGRMLGARYLLEGAFRRIGQRIKLQVSLVEAESEREIWREKIERDIADLVDVEEEIAAQIAGVVAPELEGAEARRAMNKPTADLDAWELAMRATWLLTRGDRAGYPEAEELAMRSAELAPGWVRPYTLIAVARFQQAMTGFSTADSSQAFASTLDAAKDALAIDHNAWIAHALAGVGELWTHRNHERALLHVERAIALNPSASVNYHFGGCITGFSGDPTQARRYQERLFRVDPVYPYRAVIEADLGLWHMLDAEFENADDRLTRSETWDPSYGRALQRRIALAGLQGKRDVARAAAARLSDLGLALDLDVITASYPFRKPEHHDMFADGLRRSGVNL